MGMDFKSGIANLGIVRKLIAALAAPLSHTHTYLSNGAAPIALSKLNPDTVAFIKTGSGTVSIKAGTDVNVNGTYVSFAVNTAVTMPTLVAGTDYTIWVRDNGQIQATSNWDVAPAAGTWRKIGGFHYGLVASGATVASGSFATAGPSMAWTQADVDRLAGINEWSFWDLTFRPTCDPRGMTCVKDKDGRGRFWFDIYFCSQDHITNGTSKYNTNVASGTVPPRVPLLWGGNGSANYSNFVWHYANEIAHSHGKRLMSYPEFTAASFGVTENQSIGGSAVTISATGRTAGYTSRYGGEQMTGHHYTFGTLAVAVTGSAWAAQGRGSVYGMPTVPMFGGHRSEGTYSGSRCAYFLNTIESQSWAIGARYAADHIGY